MSPQENSRPTLIIVAGPNGSGKSTAFNSAGFELEGHRFWIINPDLLTARIAKAETLALADANLAAVQRIESWLYASIDVHQSIGVETVLSTKKYKRLVKHAKARGFAIWLVYVALDSPERNIERVAIRVTKGGHHVPDDKIRDRYTRSLANLKWFLDAADRAWVFDNSNPKISLVASKENGVVDRHDDAPELLDRAIRGVN
jgi:predicted ABC-type ATPase